MKQLTGEPGIPLFERLWARPTFEVHGIRGGFIGEGAKTVIPARATDPWVRRLSFTAAIAAVIAVALFVVYVVVLKAGGLKG